MAFYTTIENQQRVDGSFGLLYDHFENYNSALAKHYTTCAAAATSGIPYHAAILIADNGMVLKQEIFDRRVEDEE